MTDRPKQPPLNRLIFAIYSHLPEESRIKQTFDEIVAETLEYDAEARKVYQDPSVPLPTATVVVGLGQRILNRIRRGKKR